LNGYRLKRRRQIDWEQQFEQALQAFAGNGFVLLVDDRQMDDLEAEIVVSPETMVTFLKLVALVGG
jgi:hypothetical protein